MLLARGFRTQVEDDGRAAWVMVLPFRRRGEEEERPAPSLTDHDLDAILAEGEDGGKKSGAQDAAEGLEGDSLRASALRVVETCMDIRRNENVLIVCDPTTSEIGASLHAAALQRSDRVLLMLMPKGRHHGQEPPTPVANLMRQQQVVIAPTRYSLTHTRAVRAALAEGARIATMPGMTEAMFQGGGMSADFTMLKQRIAKVAGRVRRKRIVNVRTEAGTNLQFEVAWREWNFDDNGICNRPKMLTNLPAGKAFVMPREGTMKGTIVLDGSWEGTLVDEPVTIEVAEGMMTSISGGEMAGRIRKAFEEAREGLRPKDQDLVGTVAEFGFGMNPAATLSGNILEDEKCLGTCYFVFGDNTSGGGNSSVGFTLSCVVRNPSIQLDVDPLFVHGELLED